MNSDVRGIVDPNSQILKAMDEEDSEPRIARIRENLVGKLFSLILWAFSVSDASKKVQLREVIGIWVR